VRKPSRSLRHPSDPKGTASGQGAHGSFRARGAHPIFFPISAGGPLAARALRRGFLGLCCSTASYPPFLVAHRPRASRWRLGSQRTLPPASGRHAIWLDRRQMAATAFTPRRPVAGMGRHWTTGPPAHTSPSLAPLLAPCDHSVSCCRPSLFWNLER